MIVDLPYLNFLFSLNMHIAKALTKVDVHECMWLNIKVYCMKNAGNGRTAKDAAMTSVKQESKGL